MDNVMKVKIINYQRIKKASLEFIPGLNVIIGQTNNGKSSLIRALETAIYNISREGHVTLGETKSAVGIEYRGHQVIWRRDTEASSQVTYRVDGKIYGKLGRGQPDVVKEALGISEVEINEQKFRVNFSKQMSYPFLLNVTPSELFKFIVQSSEEDNVVEVLNTMRSDVNEISSNVKKYDEARNTLGITYQREVTKFKEKKQYLPTCNEILELDGKVKRLKTLKEAIESYEKCRYVVQKAEEAINKLGKTQKLIIETENRVKDKIDAIDNLMTIIGTYDKVSDEEKALSLDIEVNKSTMESLRELEKYDELLKNMEPNQIKLKMIKQKTEDYENKTKEYHNTCEVIENTLLELEKKEKVAVAVSKALVRTDKSSESLAELQSMMKNHEQLMSDLGIITVKEEELLKQVRELDKEIDEIGVCPYCGNEIKGGSHEHN